MKIRHDTSALARATRVLAAAALLATAACDGDEGAGTLYPSDASPSAKVIGVAPAEPRATTRDTPATTPPPGARGEVGPVAESVLRPLPGDNHSYESLEHEARKRSRELDAGRERP